MISQTIEMPLADLKDFCSRNHVRALSLFGSITRNDFTPESDVDILLEFEPGFDVGYLTFAHMENELSDLLQRKVDLQTPSSLSPLFRDEVLRHAEPLYVAA